MEQVDLAVDKRTGSGKRVAQGLRRQGFIPANLHGLKENKAVSLSINARVFMHAIHSEASSNVIFNLCFTGVKKKPETVIVKEIQHDPVKGTITHIDFQKISLKEKIVVSVPVHLIGQAVGVKEGGVIDHLQHEIEVEALPADIPKHIEIDIEGLNIGDAVHVGDLNLGEAVEIITKADETIVSISHQVAAAEPTEEEEEVAVEEESIEPEVMSHGKETTEGKS